MSIECDGMVMVLFSEAGTVRLPCRAPNFSTCHPVKMLDYHVRSIIVVKREHWIVVHVLGTSRNQNLVLCHINVLLMPGLQVLSPAVFGR